MKVPKTYKSLSIRTADLILRDQVVTMTLSQQSAVQREESNIRLAEIS